MRARRRRTAFFVALLAIGISAISIAAQSDPVNAVMLFNGRDASGGGQPIPAGVYQVSGKQLGSEASVKVPKGFVVRFCSAKDGTGNCEEFGEGIHNLVTVDFNYIKVAKRTEPASSTQPPVVVYELEHWSGRAQVYTPGMYRAIKGEFGNILNDHAMSVVVAKGFRARFCTEEGYELRGAGNCEVHEAGRHELRLADSISFIEVTDLSAQPSNDLAMPVVLYEDPTQVGKMQGFDVGTFVASRGEFKQLRDNQASSIWVKDGYRAMVCKDEPSSPPATADCEEFGPGKKNIKARREASYLKVWKVSN